MKRFDFSDIDKVARIELKPDEFLLLQTSYDLTPENAAFIKSRFNGTPLEGRVFILCGDWKAATVATT